MKGPKHSFFFSGDSGYFDELKQIGAKLGPFDLALVKIGACDVTWQDIHMSPEEAVRTTQDVRGAGVSLVVPRPGELVEPGQPTTSAGGLDTWWR